VLASSSFIAEPEPAPSNSEALAPALEEALWRRLKSDGDMLARDALIRHHMGFARILAARAYARRYADTVSFAEFMQLASVGLIEAVDRFSPQDGRASFRTYAAHWIRGAVLDGLRTLTEVHAQIDARKQSQRDRMRSFKDEGPDKEAPARDAFNRLADMAVGVALGFMLDDIRMYRDGDGTVEDRCGVDLEARRMRALLETSARSLPSKERLLIEKHYFEGLKFEEIAGLLALSKGRVSQLHKQALGLLRTAMRQAGHGDWSA
jgi:RNA polymerase sigma factor for flagellar operon FliA